MRENRVRDVTERRGREEWKNRGREREREMGREKRTQEISGNSLGGKGTRQLEPKTKDWFSLFHEGDKRSSKGRGSFDPTTRSYTLL